MISKEIKNAVELEKRLNEQKESAVAESKRKLLLAQRAGERLLEDNRQNIEVEQRVKIAEAESLAEVENKKLLSEAEVRYERKKEEARQRLDETANWIVERIIGT